MIVQKKTYKIYIIKFITASNQIRTPCATDGPNGTNLDQIQSQIEYHPYCSIVGAGKCLRLKIYDKRHGI